MLYKIKVGEMRDHCRGVSRKVSHWPHTKSSSKKSGRTEEPAALENIICHHQIFHSECAVTTCSLQLVNLGLIPAGRCGLWNVWECLAFLTINVPSLQWLWVIIGKATYILKDILSGIADSTGFSLSMNFTFQTPEDPLTHLKFLIIYTHTYMNICKNR